MKRSGRPTQTTGKEATVKTMARFSLVALFFVILTLGKIIRSRHLDSSSPLMREKSGGDHIKNLSGTGQKLVQAIEIPLNCSLQEHCSANHYPSSSDGNRVVAGPPPPSCPDYFRWIYDDLSPWRKSGISEEIVMRGRPTANFRLVIVDGKAYMETYRRSFQTRDIFTKWGILQLLRKYPGKLPDLDLLFDCDDYPVIMKENSCNKTIPGPAPLFTYCGNESTLDIVFPDWSFWGWPEIATKPWETILKELEEANKKSEWKEREAYAYWKGNPEVAETRRDLLTCNVSDKMDWNALLYVQDWYTERALGFKNSSLADQCMHRYKIYIEGCTWSVSMKYILACDSTSLIVKPNYHDFFTRGLMPLKHYWPVRDVKKCPSIKHAVHWGNNHLHLAQAIGKAGTDFIFNQVKMDYVYDYMFHLLNAYANLLTYKPTVPKNAIQICSESLVCPTKDIMRQYMMDSRVKGPSLSEPCSMPPPYDPASLHSIIQTKQNRLEQVDTWEKNYWEGLHR